MISKQKLQSMYTLLKMEEAAKELGLGITALKKYCRKHGIKRWPHRQLKSLDNLISALKGLVSKADSIQGGEEECVQTAITQLEYYKKRIATDPCYKIPRSVFRLRQAQFKDKHKRLRSSH